MSKPLTEELIIQKTKCSSLSQIKNLNLWGSEIGDISILKQLPNAEVLSLSVNKISSLKDFQYCKNLQELYLRKNNIADLQELKYLSNLPSLKVLWLQDNPCAETQDYRKIVISFLPNLIKLDNTQITPEEKQEIMFIKNNEHILQKLKIQQKGDYNYQYQNENERSGVNQNSNTNKNNPSTLMDFGTSNNQQQFERQNQNVVCAILSLIQDLDINSLEIVRRDVLKKLERMSN